MTPSFADFDCFPFTAGEITKKIYRSPQNGPAVILIHELPGMIPECQRRGEWLAAQGFTVYMPLLFGKPGDNLGVKPFFFPCVRREFHLWGADKTSPIVGFLTELAKVAHEECGGPGVGAIGMCLTGGFGLGMMVEPSVRAPVVCQPSIPNPLLPVSQIGLSPLDLEKASTRCKKENIDVLGFRFAKDPLCPRKRFEKLENALGERFVPHVIGQDGRSSPKGHSTLTLDFYQNEAFADDEKREIEQKLVDHLDRYLRDDPSQQ